MTERIIRTEAATRVTLENRKGLDGPAVLAALEDATARVRPSWGTARPRREGLIPNFREERQEMYA